MQIITHFVKFKPKYKLEMTSKFKFNKGTIATHNTISDSQHRVILTFSQFSHFSYLLNTCVILLKQYTEIGVNWLIAIGNKAKANIQIVIQLCANKIIYIIPMKFIQVYTSKGY